jgi:tRNA(fMet)-specific endonuclease VapC
MPRFLLDTNALSEPVKPVPDKRFMTQLALHREQVAISTITWHEAVYGLHRLPVGRRREALHHYLFSLILPSMPMLQYDMAAADWHGIERARLAAAGVPLPFADGQIAAIAKTQGLILVTDNTRDFQHYEGLEIVSWKL